jgi:hypothetical protein
VTRPRGRRSAAVRLAAPLLLALAGLAPAPASAGDVLSGEEWLRLPPAARAAYVTGITDAWSGLALTQESLGSRDQAITVFTEIVACVHDRSIPQAQVLALVEKYAADNPGLRTKDMPDLVFAALAQRCRP